jgi:hypothetical protein
MIPWLIKEFRVVLVDVAMIIDFEIGHLTL